MGLQAPHLAMHVRLGNLASVKVERLRLEPGILGQDYVAYVVAFVANKGHFALVKLKSILEGVKPHVVLLHKTPAEVDGVAEAFEHIEADMEPPFVAFDGER